MSESIEWTVVGDAGDLPQKSSKRFGHVYVVEYGDCIKIGHSTNLKSRIQTLKSSAFNYSGVSIGRIVFTQALTSYVELEKYLHKVYKSYRVNNGELFRLPLENVFCMTPPLRFLGDSISTKDILNTNKLQELYVSWKGQNMRPCGHGVFGPVATEYGLTHTEALILAWVNFLSHKKNSKFVTIDGKQYVWMHYPLFLQQFPMANATSSHNLSTLISVLIKRGLLEKYNEHGTKTGHRVYFHIPERVHYFLFNTAHSTSALKNLCREWMDYQTTMSLEAEHGYR